MSSTRRSSLLVANRSRGESISINSSNLNLSGGSLSFGDSQPRIELRSRPSLSSIGHEGHEGHKLNEHNLVDLMVNLLTTFFELSASTPATTTTSSSTDNPSPEFTAEVDTLPTKLPTNNNTEIFNLSSRSILTSSNTFTSSFSHTSSAESPTNTVSGMSATSGKLRDLHKKPTTTTPSTSTSSISSTTFNSWKKHGKSEKPSSNQPHTAELTAKSPNYNNPSSIKVHNKTISRTMPGTPVTPGPNNHVTRGVENFTPATALAYEFASFSGMVSPNLPMSMPNSTSPFVPFQDSCSGSRLSFGMSSMADLNDKTGNDVTNGYKIDNKRLKIVHTPRSRQHTPQQSIVAANKENEPPIRPNVIKIIRKKKVDNNKSRHKLMLPKQIADKNSRALVPTHVQPVTSKAAHSSPVKILTNTSQSSSNAITFTEYESNYESPLKRHKACISTDLQSPLKRHKARA